VSYITSPVILYALYSAPGGGVHYPARVGIDCNVSHRWLGVTRWQHAAQQQWQNGFCVVLACSLQLKISASEYGDVAPPMAASSSNYQITNGSF
jgi:hypothetical protein